MHSATSCDSTPAVSACALRALCESLEVDPVVVAHHAGLPVSLLEQGRATPAMIATFTEGAIALSADRA